MRKAAIFLYSKSFTIAVPWVNAGIDCYLFDLGHGADRGASYGHQEGKLITYGGYIQEHRKTLGYLCRNNEVLIVGSFSPCTDVAISGAKHFEKKALNDALVWAKSMELYYHGIFLADYYNIPYFSENPMSMISTLDRKADHKFHPCDFGGYLPEAHQNSSYPDIYPNRDAYKKQTWLWTGNGFVMPEKRPVTPVSNDYPGWSKLGGGIRQNERNKEHYPGGIFTSNFRGKLPQNYRLN